MRRRQSPGDCETLLSGPSSVDHGSTSAYGPFTMTAQHYVVAIGVVRDGVVGWCQATADLDVDGDHIIAVGQVQVHAGDPPTLACDEAAIAEALKALAAKVSMAVSRRQPSPGGLRGPCC